MIVEQTVYLYFKQSCQFKYNIFKNFNTIKVQVSSQILWATPWQDIWFSSNLPINNKFLSYYEECHNIYRLWIRNSTIFWYPQYKFINAEAVTVQGLVNVQITTVSKWNEVDHLDKIGTVICKAICIILNVTFFDNLKICVSFSHAFR